MQGCEFEAGVVVEAQLATVALRYLLSIAAVHLTLSRLISHSLPLSGVRRYATTC